MTPSFRGVALYSRCPVRSSLLDHLCWVCGPSCCNWVFVAIGLFVHGWPSGWLTVRLNPNHSMRAAMKLLTIWSGIHLNGVWCLPRSPFGHATCEAYSILLWCSLKLATLVVLVLGHLGGTLVQANARCYLWWALGQLFGATVSPQFVAAFAGPWCILEGPHYFIFPYFRIAGHIFPCPCFLITL